MLSSRRSWVTKRSTITSGITDPVAHRRFSARRFAHITFQFFGWLFLIGVLASNQTIVAADEGIAIEWDPSTPTKADAVWLGYLMARATYRPDHPLPSPTSGEILPTFEEEVYARGTAATIYSELHDKDKGLNDPYWNDLLQVKRHHFMPEYVWTYLRRPSWSEKSKPRNLEEFQKWSRSNLTKHKAQTRGALAVNKG